MNTITINGVEYAPVSEMHMNMKAKEMYGMPF